MKKIHYLLSIGAVAIAALLPLVTADQFVLHICVMIFIYVGITVAWNILAFGGILSLGHAAFFGIGSYTVALLYVNLNINPWLGILAAMLTAGIGALCLAIPLLRLRGPFFTLSTLAFVEVLRLIAIYWVGLTNGSVGITTPPAEGWALLSFQERQPYYYIVLFMTLIAISISVWIYHSKMGYHLRAVASDEDAVRALGVRTPRLKLTALVISAALTGAFGAFTAMYFFVIEPETNFSATLYSIQPALNGIIGGMGTLLGPIVGALLMTPLGEWLRTTFSGATQGLNFVIYGIVLIVIVRVMPGGIVAGFTKLYRRFRPAERSAGSGDSKDRTAEEIVDDDHISTTAGRRS